MGIQLYFEDGEKAAFNIFMYIWILTRSSRDMSTILNNEDLITEINRDAKIKMEYNYNK